jgi:hypothetical protein
MTEPIVSRACIAYPPGGPAFSTRIGVLPPTVDERQAWQCKLSVDGVLDEERIAFGADAWQALQMGMHMAWIELTLKTALGWRFGWPDGTGMALDELLPPWGVERAPKFP